MRVMIERVLVERNGYRVAVDTDMVLRFDLS